MKVEPQRRPAAMDEPPPVSRWRTLRAGLAGPAGPSLDVRAAEHSTLRRHVWWDGPVTDEELREQIARVDMVAARMVKRIYPWWPLENLLNVAQRLDLTEPLTGLTHVQLGLNTYVATWERDYGWTKITEGMVIPPEVIAEMTEGYTVFTVNMHDPDPWQPVADKINAAAQRCALRYMRRP